MKKFTLFIVVVLCIAHLVKAQLKLYVYESNGETTEFIASNVDSIAFTAPGTYPINPKTEEYVDLGLSVRWATCNVGATTPEQFGDYFAWGEIDTKDYYDIDNYKWCNGTSGTLTKYCMSKSNGKVDNKTQLDLVDDVANVDRGGRWRMPTENEFKELLENCTITWTDSNGIYGCELVSKINGNSIFIPAAGYYYYNEMDCDYFGYYWTSSLDTNNSDRAMQFAFNEDGNKIMGSTRYFGQPVRPVIP